MQPNIIDISHHNTIRDFKALKEAGILGVIHKTTEGTSFWDKEYSKRRKLALDVGLLWGAYHFNTGDNVERQVKFFFDRAQPDEHTLMALDFEDHPRASNMSIKGAKEFLKIADEKLGRKLVLYSGNRVKDLLGKEKDEFLGSHRLWLAQYARRWITQSSWEKPWLWQYSERGRLPGTDGNIDLNFYDGDKLSEEWA